jgi:hypothetical protein
MRAYVSDGIARRVSLACLSGYAGGVDPLRLDDLERARRTPIEERARQALELMRTGIRLRRIALRARFPEASEEEIEGRLWRWLARDD